MSTITLLGTARRACCDPTRRETLQAGALSLLGGLFGAPTLKAAAASPAPSIKPRAKSVVLLYLQGGPPTQDMWDLKPHAPDGDGGEFKPIATSAPGVEISELLPKTFGGARRGRHSRREHLWRVRRSGSLHQRPPGSQPRHLRDDLNLPGIDPEMTVADRGGRAVAIAPGGRAVTEILG